MSPSAQALQSVNERLRDFLDQMGRVSSQQQQLEPGKVADLLNTVLQAGECLRAPTQGVSDPRWEREAQAYRSNLERLRGLLPLLEVQLRMERSRLESERSHLQTASEWASSSRQTF